VLPGAQKYFKWSGHQKSLGTTAIYLSKYLVAENVGVDFNNQLQSNSALTNSMGPSIFVRYSHMIRYNREALCSILNIWDPIKKNI
jgi:hypothetical protein